MLEVFVRDAGRSWTRRRRRACSPIVDPGTDEILGGCDLSDLDADGPADVGYWVAGGATAGATSRVRGRDRARSTGRATSCTSGSTRSSSSVEPDNAASIARGHRSSASRPTAPSGVTRSTIAAARAGARRRRHHGRGGAALRACRRVPHRARPRGALRREVIGRLVGGPRRRAARDPVRRLRAARSPASRSSSASPMRSARSWPASCSREPPRPGASSTRHTAAGRVRGAVLLRVRGLDRPRRHRDASRPALAGDRGLARPARVVAGCRHRADQPPGPARGDEHRVLGAGPRRVRA